MLRHPKVALCLQKHQEAYSERLGITTETVTRMLMEDRELAHRQGQTHAAIQATMGVAKLHGLLEPKQAVGSKETHFKEMSDEELIGLVRAEQEHQRLQNE